MSLYFQNPNYLTVFAIDREIETATLDKSDCLGRIIDYYLENDSITKLILLLEEQPENTYKMDAVGAALMSGNIGLANEIMATLELETESEEYWGEIMEIALSLADSGITWFSMDSSMISTVTNIAQVELECTAKRNAQSIMKLVFGIDYTEGEFSDSTVYRVISTNGDQTLHHKSVEHINKLTLFPNPAIRYLTIKYPSVASTGLVKIMDITGKVLKYEVLKHNSSSIELDIADIANGIYFIVYHSEFETLSEKFIIHR